MMADGVAPAPEAAGAAMHALIARLYPICRSITGDGVRETLAILREHIPLEVREVPSGAPVFDWTVPLEWNIRDAYVKNSRGERVIDFKAHNLSVVSYSAPIHARMSLAELKAHLHAEAEHPDWIPYRTSYYQENWGFCLAWNALQALPEDEYEVRIDSALTEGALTYGECFLPGTSPDEVLISTHVCHPSLANDNLSGIAVAVELIKGLMAARPRLSYRFLFIPGTIGSITWLALNEARLGAIRHGLVAVNLGDPGMMHYKKSRQGDAAIDRVVAHVLKARGPHRILDFSPYGYDERQFCSPGIDLPVGCLSRTPYGQFPEYHTSADNLDLVRAEALEDSLDTVRAIFDMLERDGTYLNLSPKGEPQLGKRGLYAAIGGRSDTKDRQMAMLWVLNQSDGAHSLLDIAERSGMDFALIADAAETLAAHDLLARREEAMSFAGRTAVVTGASSGIGAAIAVALAAAGAAVHALARHPAGDARLIWHAVDLAEDAGIAGFTAPWADAPLDILVHGAGLLTSGTVADTPIAALDRQYQVNLRAPYLLTQGLLPALTRARGQIVFLNSSVWGNARGGMTGYAASKYALKAFADALRAEVNEGGLRVLSVYPGRTASRMQAEVHAAEGRPYRPEALLRPEDIAGSVLAALALPATAEVTDLHIRPARKTG